MATEAQNGDGPWGTFLSGAFLTVVPLYLASVAVTPFFQWHIIPILFVAVLTLCGVFQLVRGAWWLALRRKMDSAKANTAGTHKAQSFFIGILKWSFYGFMAYVLYTLYTDDFLPLSTANKLLTVAAILLAFILYALWAILDHLRRRTS